MAEEDMNQPVQPQEEPQEPTQEQQQTVQPQEEAPPQVIEIRPPPPFEGEGLDSIIEEYAKLRGLDDKRAAAVKLARAMYSLGVNPERYTKNVETYINNMSSLLEAIPDTEETMPVKGALLGKTALEASRLIHKAHFPEEYDFDLQRDLAAVRRMALTLKMIDKVFGGENEVGNKEIELLKKKIEAMEEKDKFQQMLQPIQMQIQQIQKQIENLTNKQGMNAPEPLLAEIRRLNEKISMIEKQYGLTKEISDIKQQINALASKPAPTPTTQAPAPVQPADPTEQLTTFIDKTTKLLNTLKDYAKTYGKEAGELDWRSVAISTIGEVGTEAIRAFREVQSQRKMAETQTQGTVDPIIERRVYNYAMRKIQEGATTLNTVEAAKELGLTPMQVWDALTSIKNKGSLTAQAVKEHAKKEKAQVEDHTGIEEGEIAGVEET